VKIVTFWMKQQNVSFLQLLSHIFWNIFYMVVHLHNLQSAPWSSVPLVQSSVCTLRLCSSGTIFSLHLEALFLWYNLQFAPWSSVPLVQSSVCTLKLCSSGTIFSLHLEALFLWYNLQSATWSSYSGTIFSLHLEALFLWYNLNQKYNN
jgi:hypothetical protein